MKMIVRAVEASLLAKHYRQPRIQYPSQTTTTPSHLLGQARNGNPRLRYRQPPCVERHVLLLALLCLPLLL